MERVDAKATGFLGTMLHVSVEFLSVRMQIILDADEKKLLSSNLSCASLIAWACYNCAAFP